MTFYLVIPRSEMISSQLVYSFSSLNWVFSKMSLNYLKVMGITFFSKEEYMARIQHPSCLRDL